MTAAAAPGMERVRREFEDRDVAFLLVYVREAHPGEHYPAHQTLEEKKRDAQALAEQERIGAPVVIDDVEGTIHKAYGLQPNMLYVIDKRGHVAFRALWAEEGTVRRALTELLERERRGEETVVGESLGTAIPMLHGLAEVPRVLSRAGQQAVEDFRPVIGRVGWSAARALALARPVLRAALPLQLTILAAAGLLILGLILTGLL